MAWCILMCGASTGKLNVYTIATEALAKAQELGFKLLITGKMANEIRAPLPARRGATQNATARANRRPDSAALFRRAPINNFNDPGSGGGRRARGKSTIVIGTTAALRLHFRDGSGRDTDRGRWL